MLVITPNLCFDSTIRMAALVPGAVSRATFTALTAGGKGVNVMRALAPQQRDTARLIGFLPQQDGGRLAEYLRAERIGFAGVPVDGAVRVCTIVLEDTGRTTVVNGPGPHISATAWQQLRRTATASMRRGDPIVCNGSLPPGVAADGYAQIVADAHDAGCLAIVDAAAQPLRAALPLQPDLVCPNLSEAESLLRGRADEQVDEQGSDVVDRAIAAADELLARGAQRAVVTAGSRGAALATPAGAWWLTAPAVTVVSTIGAGDSFVAGAAGPLARGESDVEAVTRGVAAASASCEQQLAGGVDHHRVEQLIRQMSVERVRPGDATGATR